MKRRLMGAMTILSLLLALAIAGLWGLSAVWEIDSWHYSAPDSAGIMRYWAASSRNGRIYWIWLRAPAVASDLRLGYHAGVYPAQPNPWPWLFGRTRNGICIGGFYWEHPTGPTVRPGGCVLAVPDYFLLAVLLVLPLRWWLKRRGYPPNCCPACGYDLRATPDASGALLPRCPECGNPAPAPAVAR